MGNVTAEEAASLAAKVAEYAAPNAGLPAAAWPTERIVRLPNGGPRTTLVFPHPSPSPRPCCFAFPSSIQAPVRTHHAVRTGTDIYISCFRL